MGSRGSICSPPEKKKRTRTTLGGRFVEAACDGTCMWDDGKRSGVLTQVAVAHLIAFPHILRYQRTSACGTVLAPCENSARSGSRGWRNHVLTGVRQQLESALPPPLMQVARSPWTVIQEPVTRACRSPFSSYGFLGPHFCSWKLGFCAELLIICCSSVCGPLCGSAARVLYS